MCIRDRVYTDGVTVDCFTLDPGCGEFFLTRLGLEVYTDNEPAIRLYTKFGFEIEGTLRRSAFRNGQFVDSYACLLYTSRCV